MANNTAYLACLMVVINVQFLALTLFRQWELLFANLTPAIIRLNLLHILFPGNAIKPFEVVTALPIADRIACLAANFTAWAAYRLITSPAIRPLLIDAAVYTNLLNRNRPYLFVSWLCHTSSCLVERIIGERGAFEKSAFGVAIKVRRRAYLPRFQIA